MSASRAVRVRKRDGHEEQLDELRLIASLERALRAADEHEAWARQFCEATVLRCVDDSGVYETADLARAAVEVMQRFGCRRAAEIYSRRRRAEERARRALRIHVAGAGGPRSAPWDRSRLQLALQRDRYLERADARGVARRVERRLSAMGQRHVTARLVSAVADNECRVLGLASAALGAERVGPERRHLRAWLGGDCVPEGHVRGLPGLGPEDGDLRPHLGEELLASFALEELLPADAVDARDAGRLELIGIGDWLRPLISRLHPQAEESGEDFWHRVAESSQGAREVQVFVPEAWATATARTAPDWLQRGGARLRLATRDLALASDWAERGLWHAIPTDCWSNAQPSVRERLANAGRSLISWQPPRRLPTDAELCHGQVHGGAVLNLARAAADAGPWGEREFLIAVEETAAIACKALRALTRRACGGVRPRISLLPAGLPQAIDTLFPDPALAELKARQLMLSLRDLLDRAPARAELRPDHGRPPHVADVGARLADRDGLPGASSYPVGWLPPTATASSVHSAVASAPWLEIPASSWCSMWAESLRSRAILRES